MRDIVVLGLGNVMNGDDGVGVVALHRLRAGYEAPAGVRLVDGGAQGLQLLDLVFEGPGRELLIIGAVRDDAPPGTLIRCDDADGNLDHYLAEAFGFADPVAAARWIGRAPSRVTLLGLVTGDRGAGSSRSPEVEAEIPTLMAATLAELEDRGRPLARRPRHDAPHPGPARDGTRASRP